MRDAESVHRNSDRAPTWLESPGTPANPGVLIWRFGAVAKMPHVALAAVAVSAGNAAVKQYAQYKPAVIPVATSPTVH